MKQIILFLAVILLFLTSLPVTAQEIAEVNCKNKGGYWAGTIQGRGRTWGCIMPTKDAGKPCTDGMECESHYCIADEKDCPDKHTKNLDDPESHSCTQGKCYGKDFPPKGCYDFMEKGKHKSWCQE